MTDLFLERDIDSWRSGEITVYILQKMAILMDFLTINVFQFQSFKKDGQPWRQNFKEWSLQHWRVIPMFFFALKQSWTTELLGWNSDTVAMAGLKRLEIEVPFGPLGHGLVWLERTKLNNTI